MNYIDTEIQSISDFLSWVKESHENDVIGVDEQIIGFENTHAYYRGQSCSCWNLKPTVLRDPSIDEHALLKKASLRLNNEISSLNNYLEKMIFFQHYGLYTRLLDVTFNPLVALYVACCDENRFECDGVVYCGHNTEYQNSSIAELTAKFVFENELQAVVFGFQNLLGLEEVDINSFTNPIFVLPPINNPRIEAQNGAFILAPLFDKAIDGNTASSYRNSLEDTGFFEEQRAIIKGDNKETILQELSIVGVDSGSIYRGVEAKLKAIVAEEKYKSNRLKRIKIYNI